MNGFQSINTQRQKGAILMIALVFLIAITLLTTSSMRSSNIGLYMAQNEESRIAAEQTTMALADSIVANPASTPVVGETGFIFCTPGLSGCDRNDLPINNAELATEVGAGNIWARVQRNGPTFAPPPRVTESSIDKFTSASFTVITTYDRVDEGRGRQQVSEGVLVLVPKF